MITIKVDPQAIFQAVEPYTMTGVEVVVDLVQTVEHLVAAGIPGDMVECGVWRGGSMMAVALTLIELRDLRHLNLCDTFSGMPMPDDRDGDYAKQYFKGGELAVGLQDVRDNLLTTRYPPEYINYLVGPVEETLLAAAHSFGRLALVRLDTDFYASTTAELECLWPRLESGGVLIVDDYGDSWQGCVRAVNDFFGGPLNVQAAGTMVNHRVLKIVKP